MTFKQELSPQNGRSLFSFGQRYSSILQYSTYMYYSRGDQMFRLFQKITFNQSNKDH